jgi:hypothetical protein
MNTTPFIILLVCNTLCLAFGMWYGYTVGWNAAVKHISNHIILPSAQKLQIRTQLGLGTYLERKKP